MRALLSALAHEAFGIKLKDLDVEIGVYWKNMIGEYVEEVEKIFEGSENENTK